MERILCLHKELQAAAVGHWRPARIHKCPYHCHTTYKRSRCFRSAVPSYNEVAPLAVSATNLCQAAQERKRQLQFTTLTSHWQAIDKPLTSHWQACHSMSMHHGHCSPEHVLAHLQNPNTLQLSLQLSCWERYRLKHFRHAASQFSILIILPFPSFFVEWTQQIPTSQ